MNERAISTEKIQSYPMMDSAGEHTFDDGIEG
jgi:hypothetical protein